ncbi:MAG: hypothetical protein KatS3mg031_0069 [Chitinophagales bacterium]|nr:MAG: hypothetical protein KatS3mg031_0069 [Chitinophagales bacterium]
MNLKLQYVLLSCCLCLSLWAHAQSSSRLWWYVNGQPFYWSSQPDVLAFRIPDDNHTLQLPEDNCVKYAFTHEGYQYAIYIIYLNNGCTESEKEQIKNHILQQSRFADELPVLTLFPELTYDAAAWFTLDNLLLVNFHPEQLNREGYALFKKAYKLHAINFPEQAEPEKVFTYIFETTSADSANAIDLSRKIYEENPLLVANVQPNLITAYRPVPEKSTPAGNNPDVPPEATTPLEFYFFNLSDQKIRVIANLQKPETNVFLTIYDFFGRVVYREHISDPSIQQEIDISEWISGAYFFCIENASKQQMGMREFVKR